MPEKCVLDVHERPATGPWLLFSLQHLFAMFGATVLVPFLTGLNPAVALVSSGLGTLLYIVITKGRIPVYLGSSFAFIGPILAAKTIGGLDGALIGCAAAGLVYVVVASFIAKYGVAWLLRLLPPVVIGPVIMVIGLGLAPVAIKMATGQAAGGPYSSEQFLVALAALAIAVVFATFMRGIFGLIPILFGVLGGYLVAIPFGLVDLAKVASAPLFIVPDFMIPGVTVSPTISLTIILMVAPVALVTIAEHIGDQTVISKVTGRNFLVNPGLHRSLMGDGLATSLAAFIGGPPNTTYGENIGVVAITRVFSVYVTGGAAVLAIIFGFVGVISAFIQSIPTAVMGGVCIMLFGIIAASGMRLMIDRRVNFAEKRNLIIASVILVIGVGGAVIHVTDTVQMSSMALAAVSGVILNLVMPGREREETGETAFVASEPEAAPAE
ncbi:MAG: solute carrier family 23 protein [Rhodospirillales bacterium]|jgi:uracil permease|nr:solute carrier family 23 protein [Rhodospirillales bacterium]